MPLHVPTGSPSPVYGIEQLCKAGAVNPRSVQRLIGYGILPAPVLRGRNTVYDRRTFLLVCAIRALRARGLRALRDLRAELKDATVAELEAFLGLAAPHGAPGAADLASGEAWRRFVLAPGVELLVAGDVDAAAAGVARAILGRHPPRAAR